jgi:hypothetical protein
MEEEDSELEESCGDGFVVPNGYISEDEGVGSVQQDLDDLAAELEGAAPNLHSLALPQLECTFLFSLSLTC